MGPQPGFMNLSNNLLPMQSSHMRMPMSQFGSLGPISQPGQLGVGFCSPQNIAHNMNLAASYPINGQFGNMGQSINQVNQTMGFLPGQLFGHNLLNFQQINQNIGPYGQFCLPNLLNRNEVVPMQMQMQNSCQGGPNYAFGGSNPAPHAAVLPNPAPFATPNFGNVHSPNQAGQQINQNKKNLVYQGTQVLSFFLVHICQGLCIYLFIYKAQTKMYFYQALYRREISQAHLSVYISALEFE